jgi:predicted DsbA family dithiol-disulfide isomerase
LETALREYGPGIEVRWHSFQLDPSTPRDSTVPTTDMLVRKYRVSPDRAKAMQMNVTTLAEAEGLAYRIEDTWAENTFDAHRLLHEALAHGKQDHLKERLLSGYFERGERISQADSLRSMALEVGLPADRVDQVLADPHLHAHAVRQDIDTARQFGIQGVPFFVVDRRYGISGAQPASVLLDIFKRARAEQAPDPSAAGEQCDDEGCAVPEADGR